MLMRLAQEVSKYGVPRGLPRVAWTLRRFVVGNGTKIVWFRNRFRMYCDSESYPSVTAACGFVYRRMDDVLSLILQKSVTFIDVGANVGFVTMLACSQVRAKGGQIVAHCFEPDPGVFTRLAGNRNLNQRLFNIVVNPWAVGSMEGKGELTVSARSGWSTMASEPVGGFSFLPKAGKETVKITTLDLYCREHSLSPSIIKIDVEGFETEVLAGAAAVLSEHRPYLIVEINALRLAAAGTSSEELIRKLQRHRYRLFHINPSCATSNVPSIRREWRGLPEVNFDDSVVGEDFDAICVPSEAS